MITISIYQIDKDKVSAYYNDLYKNNYAYLRHKIDFKSNFDQYYTNVYTYEDDFGDMREDDILDSIYNKFSRNRPGRGEYMDISDVVVIDGAKYIRDIYGFQKI